MFLFKFILGSSSVAVVFGQRSSSRSDRPAARRFYQMTAMMYHYNEDWDMLKYSTYGCNCHFLVGDRPMSKPGYGQPIDELDQVCKDYKQCLNCTIDKYGNTCLPEFVQYNLDIDENGITCLDGAGTCERNLCECDKEFAINHLTAESVYNRDFSNIYSGFPYQEICPGVCSRDEMPLTETAIYSPEVYDGIYVADHELYNGKKCYRNSANQSYQIVWELGVRMGTGMGWVIKDANGPRFYSEADIPCPDTGDWFFLPNREDTDTADMIPADSIKFGGQTPGEKEESKPEIDAQCCHSVAEDTALQWYNANTHVCCVETGFAEKSLDDC